MDFHSCSKDAKKWKGVASNLEAELKVLLMNQRFINCEITGMSWKTPKFLSSWPENGTNN